MTTARGLRLLPPPHYDYCRVHQTLKTTPAVASGLADHEWSIAELVGVLDSN